MRYIPIVVLSCVLIHFINAMEHKKPTTGNEWQPTCGILKEISDAWYNSTNGTIVADIEGLINEQVEQFDRLPFNRKNNNLDRNTLKLTPDIFGQKIDGWLDILTQNSMEDFADKMLSGCPEKDLAAYKLDDNNTVRDIPKTTIYKLFLKHLPKLDEKRRPQTAFCLQECTIIPKTRGLVFTPSTSLNESDSDSSSSGSSDDEVDEPKPVNLTQKMRFEAWKMRYFLSSIASRQQPAPKNLYEVVVEAVNYKKPLQKKLLEKLKDNVEREQELYKLHQKNYRLNRIFSYIYSGLILLNGIVGFDAVIKWGRGRISSKLFCIASAAYLVMGGIAYRARGFADRNGEKSKYFIDTNAKYIPYLNLAGQKLDEKLNQFGSTSQENTFDSKHFDNF